MECEEELCTECTEHHTALKMARNHHVVDLKLKQSYASLLKMSSLVCEQHKDCDVEYFCVDHDELCCRNWFWFGLYKHENQFGLQPSFIAVFLNKGKV
jgi:hypothetical protein